MPKHTLSISLKSLLSQSTQKFKAPKKVSVSYTLSHINKVALEKWEHFFNW